MERSASKKHLWVRGTILTSRFFQMSLDLPILTFIDSRKTRLSLQGIRKSNRPPLSAIIFLASINASALREWLYAQILTSRCLAISAKSVELVVII
ncbi:hypothetical protein PFISCL1PPCAC_4337 [Pristionchus fissidentatus]|uniref:Uncharacterized protein n=1 Tax=Pristionchus fissidentatus TaxID=1538716 RepID=A0AAV5V0G6_9BILA|nr:hypothetical protein PFISCL1PPCAC_4337 [Pristionchus fissidentatus]